MTKIYPSTARDREGSFQPVGYQPAGFTIIEALIVLAIAGLILLIVFLAVPALQRNSRNTAYKNEARKFLSAAIEFIVNNSSTLPDPSNSNTMGSHAAQIYALSNPRNITTLIVEDASETSSPTLTTAILRLRSRCTTASTAAPGANKQLALLYPSEDSTGTAQPQCTDS